LNPYLLARRRAEDILQCFGTLGTRILHDFVSLLPLSVQPRRFPRLREQFGIVDCNHLIDIVLIHDGETLDSMQGIAEIRDLARKSGEFVEIRCIHNERISLPMAD
jgi:hypothetical protein